MRVPVVETDWKSVSAFETETLRSQSKFKDLDWETPYGRE